MPRIGLAELVILGGVFAVFVVPLVALVAWALLRGRKKQRSETQQ